MVHTIGYCCDLLRKHMCTYVLCLLKLISLETFNCLISKEKDQFVLCTARCWVSLKTMSNGKQILQIFSMNSVPYYLVTMWLWNSWDISILIFESVLLKCQIQDNFAKWVLRTKYINLRCNYSTKIRVLARKCSLTNKLQRTWAYFLFIICCKITQTTLICFFNMISHQKTSIVTFYYICYTSSKF